MKVKIYSAYALLALAGCGSKAEAKAPNIIFILADDMGYGDVSALNPHSKIQTPNIDRISQNGVTFTDAHSGSAVSTPTRYGILTGRYSWRTTLKSGTLNGYSRALIPQDRLTMPKMLKQQGYQTACFGKWHLGWDWNNIEAGNNKIDYSKPVGNAPTTRGFDYFYGISASLDMPPYVYLENDRPTAVPNRETEGNNIPVGEDGYDGSMWRKGPTGSDFNHADCLPNLNRRVIQYIDENSKSDKPFFVYYPMPSPHTPILPSGEFQGKSDVSTYGDFVIMIDHFVGDIVKTLERNKITDNTILVFTSDNGVALWADIKGMEAKGHYPSYVFRGNKSDLYEGGHHIPCFVQWPARITPSIVDETICLNDFMSTFAELINYKLKDNEAEDSFSLLPVLLNKKSKDKIDRAVVHHSGEGHFAIRKGQWKFLMAPGSGGWSYPSPGEEPAGSPPIQLYNMKSDIGEKINVQNKHPEVVAEMKALLIKYIKDGRSTPGRVQENDRYPWKQIDWINE